jgi:hypothetical protein
MASFKAWARWFHVRLSWRAIGAALGYFVAPLIGPRLGVEPMHVALFRDACMTALLAAIYTHERKPPRGGGGAPGLGLFGVRSEDRR